MPLDWGRFPLLHVQLFVPSAWGLVLVRLAELGVPLSLPSPLFSAMRMEMIGRLCR